MTNEELLQQAITIGESINYKLEFIIGLALFLLCLLTIYLGVKFLSKIIG